MPPANSQSTSFDTGRKEYQIKIRGELDVARLFSLNAEPLGQVLQEDIYVKGDSDALTWRIRKEHDQLLFTEKHHVFEGQSQTKVVKERTISQKEAADILAVHPIITTIFKYRSLFRVLGVIVAIDEVEHLGSFIELKGDGETHLASVVAALDLAHHTIEHRSYLEMVLAENRAWWLERMLNFHHRVEELVFGLTSGVLTTIGVLVGVNAATTSRLSVVSAIAAIAVADSYSDAYSMFLSKKSERGMTSRKAIRHALWTFLAKFILPLVLLVPIITMDSLQFAVLTSVALGLLVLILVTLEQLIVKQENIFLGLVKNLATAAIILTLSFILGSGLQLFFAI